MVLHPTTRVGAAQAGARVDALLRDAGLAGGALGVRDALGPAAGHRVALVASQARADGHLAVVFALSVSAAWRGDAWIGGNRLPRWFCGERQRS